MRFVDCVTIQTSAGHGGAGAIAFHREKFVAKGGPSGGNGGRGASVVLVADENVGTLIDLKYRRRIVAPKGQSGGAKGKDGRSGEDVILRVPLGTIVRDAQTAEILADLSAQGDSIVVAKGGRGGLGNAAFKSSTRQTPRFAQPGEEGERRWILLELKLLADIGIIGYPSVGKSTLISVISNARPRIAAYPFTTLTPNLGIVQRKDFRSFVVADIPGLIEGAHEGKGLGYQFLRHVERCRALVHLIEMTPGEGELDDGREPIADFNAICNELERFSAALAERPQIVALAKTDTVDDPERIDALRRHFTARGYEFHAFSSATRQGLDELLDGMMRLVDRTPAPDASHFTVPESDVPDEPGPETEAVLAEEDDAAILARLRRIQRIQAAGGNAFDEEEGLVYPSDEGDDDAYEDDSASYDDAEDEDDGAYDENFGDGDDGDDAYEDDDSADDPSSDDDDVADDDDNDAPPGR